MVLVAGVISFSLYLLQVSNVLLVGCDKLRPTLGTQTLPKEETQIVEQQPPTEHKEVEVAPLLLYCRSCPSNHHCNGTVCTPCKECPPGQEPIGFCTIHTDTVCGRCPNNTYSNSSSTTIRCRVCTHLTCQPDLRLRSCSSFADASCDECGDNSYYDDRFNSCTPCKSCANDELETTPCTMNTDRECQQASLPTVDPWGISWPTLTCPLLGFAGDGFAITMVTTSVNTSTPTFRAATPEQQKEIAKSSSSNLLIVLITFSVGSASILVAFILICCVCKRRRRSVVIIGEANSEEILPTAARRNWMNRQSISIPNNVASGRSAPDASAVIGELVYNDLEIRPDTLIAELPGNARTRLLHTLSGDCINPNSWNEMTKCFQQSGACRKNRALSEIFTSQSTFGDFDKSNSRAKELLEIWEDERYSLKHLGSILNQAKFLQTVTVIDKLLLSPSSEAGQCHELQRASTSEDVALTKPSPTPGKLESEPSTIACSFPHKQPTTIAERRQFADQERRLFFATANSREIFLRDYKTEISIPVATSPSKAKTQLAVNLFPQSTPPNHDTEV